MALLCNLATPGTLRNTLFYTTALFVTSCFGQVKILTCYAKTRMQVVENQSDDGACKKRSTQMIFDEDIYT